MKAAFSRCRTQRALALVAFGAALSGCGTPSGGPEYTEIGVGAADATDSELGNECVPLPILPGGTVEQDVSLAPGLSAHVLAVRDYAEVTLEGTNDPQSTRVTVSQPALLDGYSKTLDVTTVAGDTYSVFFVSPCKTGAGVPQNK